MIGKKRKKKKKKKKLLVLEKFDLGKKNEYTNKFHARWKFSQKSIFDMFPKRSIFIFRSGSTRGISFDRFYRDKCSHASSISHLFSPLPRVIENVRQCVVQRCAWNINPSRDRIFNQLFLDSWNRKSRV